MNDMTVYQNSQPTMSSREIADVVESRHDKVKQSIERLSEKGLVSFTPMGEKDTGGRPGVVYMVGKRDSYVVVAQLSPEFTARLVDRWQELENQSAEKPAELSRMDILRIAMESEQARIEAEAQRDHAVATKAEIGSKREASAMATASKATRDANRLRREMGRHSQTACILAVQKLTGQSYKFHPLKKWCSENNGTIDKVEHPVYGSVNSYCAAAWLAVYDVDLAELFPISNIEAA